MSSLSLSCYLTLLFSLILFLLTIQTLCGTAGRESQWRGSSSLWVLVSDSQPWGSLTSWRGWVVWVCRWLLILHLYVSILWIVNRSRRHDEWIVVIVRGKDVFCRDRSTLILISSCILSPFPCFLTPTILLRHSSFSCLWLSTLFTLQQSATEIVIHRKAPQRFDPSIFGFKARRVLQSHYRNELQD